MLRQTPVARSQLRPALQPRPLRRPRPLARTLRHLTRRQRVAAVVLTVVALGFVTLDLGGSGLRGAHTGMRGVLGALYRGTDDVLGPARRWLQGVPSAGTNEARVDDLRAQNAKLRRQLADDAVDRATARHLARLQLAADSTGRSVLPARVIALGPGAGFDWTVTLDVGTRDGAAEGETVTDGYGLVGRVLHADRDTSVVLLAADPDSGVGARDLRTGETALVKGHGNAGYTLTPLHPGAVVKVGDRIVTGPVGSSSYVAGIAIGTVTSVATTSGAVVATVRPDVSATALDLVGVIVAPGSTGGTRTPLAPAAQADAPAGTR